MLGLVIVRPYTTPEIHFLCRCFKFGDTCHAASTHTSKDKLCLIHKKSPTVLMLEISCFKIYSMRYYLYYKPGYVCLSNSVESLIVRKSSPTRIELFTYRKKKKKSYELCCHLCSLISNQNKGDRRERTSIIKHLCFPAVLFHMQNLSKLAKDINSSADHPWQ